MSFSCSYRGFGSSRGVSIAEILVVVSIVALGIVVAVPLISQTLRSTETRGAVEQLAVSLRAVRMIAVAHQEPRDLQIRPAPHNDYRYIDSSGKERVVELPEFASIVAFEMPPGSASSAPIRFRANGSIAGGMGSVTRIEAPLSHGRTEVWEITTNALGMSSARRLQP